MVVIHVLYDGSVSNVWKKEDKKNSLTNLVRTGRQYAGGWWSFGMGEQHRSQDALESSSSDSAEMALKYRTTGDFPVDLIVIVSAFLRLFWFVGGLPPLFLFRISFYVVGTVSFWRYLEALLLFLRDPGRSL